MIQDADDLQSLSFFLLGAGVLFFLRKKLPILLKKEFRLFSRQGWYYIGVLCALQVILLFLLYLFVDNSHLFMVGVSLCAFLLPFTVLNTWESFRDRTAQAEAKRKKIFRAGLLSSASLLLFLLLTSLASRQTQAPRIDPASASASIPPPLPGSGRSRTPVYDKVGLVLNENSSHLLELDARFSRLARTGTVTSPAVLGKTKNDIRAQEYALERLLDSLDNQGREFSVLTTAFRSLLAGHRILSRLQSEKPVQPDSIKVVGLP